MIAVIDYGVGNLFSLQRSFEAIGQNARVTADPEEILSAERIVLPGVGAFGDAAAKLRDTGLDRTVREAAAAGKPLLGICLGMQLLFERSYEYGIHEGLGLIQGEVRAIREVIPDGLKIPHMGWNPLIFKGGSSPLFRYIREYDSVYFVHSFAAFGCGDALIATAEYGSELTAAVARGNVFGTQFHPEKSGPVGLNILKAFCEFQEV